MIVVDASVWVRALLDAGPAGDAARQALPRPGRRSSGRWATPSAPTNDPDWVAPAHLPVEVLRTLRRYEAVGVLTTSQADVFAGEVRPSATADVLFHIDRYLVR